MWTILVLFYGIFFSAVHAYYDRSIDEYRTERFAASKIIPTGPLNSDEDFIKMSRSCLTDRDYKQMSSKSRSDPDEPFFNLQLLLIATDMIAQTELRAALGFGPLPPWKYQDFSTVQQMTSEPTAEQLVDMLTIYYRMFLNDGRFVEKDFPPVIEFIDHRFPEIRKTCKLKFEKAVTGKPTDITTLEPVIIAYSELRTKVNAALARLYFNDECKNLI